MVNFLLHRIRADVKKELSTSCREEYHTFYLKRSVWKAICEVQGWIDDKGKTRGAVTKFAKHLNITRQYAAGIVNGTLGCSAGVMWKIKRFVNIPEGACWCMMFSDTKTRELNTNHPIFNELKYRGEMPYEKYSPAAIFRNAETK